MASEIGHRGRFAATISKMAGEEDKYDALAVWAHSDAPTVNPEATIYRGQQAQERSRALLAAALGVPADTQTSELIRLAIGGRPAPPDTRGLNHPLEPHTAAP